MSIFKIFLSLLLLLYIAALIYLYLTQDQKIFNFSLVEKKRPLVLKECKNCKEVKLKVDGALLDGVYLENNSSELIIYFGGNADDATDFISIFKNLKNFDIVAFNYRGNALSSGKPSEKALFNDALKIYDTFAKKKEVFVVGRSLGSGVAVFLASKRDVKKLFLITPYDSIENVAKEKYPFFPIHWLIKYKFNSLKYIKDVKADIFIYMVKNDTVVSNDRTFNLLKHIKRSSIVKKFDNTTHADILEDKNFIKEFEATLKSSAE